MSTVTTEDIYNAFRDQLFDNTPSFNGKFEVYKSYTQEGPNRPSLYLSIINTQINQDIDGKPPTSMISLEVHMRADRNGFIDTPAPKILLPLIREIKEAFRPSPITGFSTLGFARGWVMHVWPTSEEYYYDLLDDVDIMDAIIGFQIFAAPDLG